MVNPSPFSLATSRLQTDFALIQCFDFPTARCCKGAHIRGSVDEAVFRLTGLPYLRTPAAAATVQPRYLNISLSNDDPSTVMQSYIFSRFPTSEIYSFILLRSETWFPNAVIAGESSAAIHFWFGTLGQTKVNAGLYQLTGTLSRPQPPTPMPT